ncbi:unnamed protein product, partial [marine sediment metagenome]
MGLIIDDIELDGQSIPLSQRLIAVDWGFNGVYGHSSTSYAYMAFNAMIPKRSDIDGYVKIEA